jgi:hypothetical protein
MLGNSSVAAQLTVSQEYDVNRKNECIQERSRQFIRLCVRPHVSDQEHLDGFCRIEYAYEYYAVGGQKVSAVFRERGCAVQVGALKMSRFEERI